MDLPIIKFSVDWWNTLHQPSSIIRLDGPTIDSSMLWPLLVMVLAFELLFVTLWLLGIDARLAERRTHALWLRRGASEPAPAAQAQSAVARG
ncbi:hypothetical protein HRbin39_01536 [bacterium HR39]|nr:hypothetical protein HRbin39_01536 [bacterium HR39]